MVENSVLWTGYTIKVMTVKKKLTESFPLRDNRGKRFIRVSQELLYRFLPIIVEEVVLNCPLYRPCCICDPAHLRRDVT